MKIEVVPPDTTWKENFEAESKRLKSIMGANIIAIHHMGSTAIPGIYAKPVIDLLIEVKEILKTDEQNEVMAAIGYEAMGEFGLPGRRYFRKNHLPDIRTHNVHVYQVGSPEIARHLAFRDYMIAHPDAAQQYSELKRKLAKQYPQDIEGYMDGKDEFVKIMEKKALEWKAMTQTHQNLLTKAYAAFNDRDIDAVLAVMHPEVQWANGMEGGYVYGHEAVHDYWTRQWKFINPHVEPTGFQLDENGRVVVDVHQVVHDLDGNLIVEQTVQHLYTIKDELIQQMDIRDDAVESGNR